MAQSTASRPRGKNIPPAPAPASAPAVEIVYLVLRSGSGAVDWSRTPEDAARALDRVRRLHPGDVVWLCPWPADLAEPLFDLFRR